MDAATLQSALTTLGLKPGPIDGLIGKTTLKAVDALLERNQHRLSPTFKATPARKLIAAEQLVYWSAGFDVGAIDGFKGPQTLQAEKEWIAMMVTGAKPLPWRDATLQPRLSDANLPDKVKSTWPRQAEVEKFFGARGENQAMLDLPFSMRLDWDLKTTIRKFSIHEKCHDSAQRVFGRVLSEYGEEGIKKLGLDRFGGCLNVRKMRGGDAWSMHSWGIAIDMYPSKNQLQWGRDKALFGKPEYAPFWRLWTEEGWLSLGLARNYDYMHVQAARL